MRRTTRGAFLLLAIGFAARGQQLTFSGSIRSRVENWGWFQANSGESSYTYVGNTIRFGLSRSLPRFDWNLEFEAPVLLNLPSTSIAPGNHTHGTFFQILPTARPYAQFPFHNMMNNVDRFAMLTLRPHARVNLRTELHFLRLANRNDLWYLGGGAFQPWTFGFQSRSGGGALGLANLYSFGTELILNPHLTVSPYYGHATGKGAIQAVYPRGPNGHLFFLETNYRF